MDRICKQRGWSRRGLLQSLLSPQVHKSIDATVAALSYTVPERFALLAVAALQSDEWSFRRQYERFADSNPTIAMDARNAGAEAEDALRFFGGILREYAQLHALKDGRPHEGAPASAPAPEDLPPRPPGARKQPRH